MHKHNLWYIIIEHRLKISIRNKQRKFNGRHPLNLLFLQKKRLDIRKLGLRYDLVSAQLDAYYHTFLLVLTKLAIWKKTTVLITTNSIVITCRRAA